MQMTPPPPYRNRPQFRFTGAWNAPRFRNRTAFGVIFSLVAASSCANVSPAPITPRKLSTVELTACDLPKSKEAALCGKYHVYENRAAKSGRMIALNIVVLPAQSVEPKSDPVFYFAGGPGQGAARISGAGEDSIMRELRRERDLVFVDMRGTGDSNGLQCAFGVDRSKMQSFYGEIFDPNVIEKCKDKLETIADLKFYHTRLQVEDIEDVRSALGYDAINLYGVSHGSQAALEYLRRYSNHVRTATLAGVLTPAAKVPLQFARGAEQAITRLFHDCAGDEACASAYPHLARDFSRLMETLTKSSVQLDFSHSSNGTAEPIRISRGVFVVRLLSLLYQHRTASLLPLVISSAAKGDWGPFIHVVSKPSASPEFRVYFGAYLSTTCAESLAFIDEAELASATAKTFMGDYRTKRHQKACEAWPRGEIGADFFQPVRVATPVLMLSGDIDPATPAMFGEQALKTLPNGRQVILRNTPHSYTSPCARRLVVEFIAGASAKDLDASCAARLRRPPFATELPTSYNH